MRHASMALQAFFPWQSLGYVHYILTSTRLVPRTSVSVSTNGKLFVSCLNDNLQLNSVPNGAAITLGSKILAVRHRKVKTKRELLHCSLGDKDIWVRIADPASKRRFVVTLLQGFATFLERLVTTATFVVCITSSTTLIR